MTREEAINEIKSWDFLEGKEIEAIHTLIPELRESEDERIRMKLCEFISDTVGDEFDGYDISKDAALAYLEKQKEQKPIQSDEEKEYVRVLKSLISDFIRDNYKTTDINFYQRIYDWLDGRHIEQKPISTEDMPYITDEHFYEREPADSFKYKLAEYMTKNCTKKEGPDGYTYGISAESILKMAEEELLKRGVVQKPAEWSEEDETRLTNTLIMLKEYAIYHYSKDDVNKSVDWLENRFKSLRPSWKPSEINPEEVRLLDTTISFLKDFADKGYENAVECIDWLKSKRNGTACK